MVYLAPSSGIDTKIIINHDVKYIYLSITLNDYISQLFKKYPEITLDCNLEAISISTYQYISNSLH